MGSSSSAWKLITPPLLKNAGSAENRAVIAIDLPGHGETPLAQSHMSSMDPSGLARVVKEALDEIGVEKFHLAGNSLGGWIALEIAAQFHNNVLSVTGIAPAGLWLVPATKREKLGAFARVLAAATYRIAPWLMKFTWARRIGFESVSPLWQELSIETCVDATIAYGSSRGYYLAWDGMLGTRFDKEISPSIPVTIIFGDTDNTLPAAHSQERSLAPAHSEWVRLEKSGHAPMWDQYERVSSEILKTMKRASNPS